MFITLLSFSISLACIAKVSDYVKCMSLNNEPCIARPTFIDLNSNELHYFPFRVSVHRCKGNCNTLEYLSSKTEDVNLNVFNQ